MSSQNRANHTYTHTRTLCSANAALSSACDCRSPDGSWSTSKKLSCEAPDRAAAGAGAGDGASVVVSSRASAAVTAGARRNKNSSRGFVWSKRSMTESTYDHRLTRNLPQTMRISTTRERAVALTVRCCAPFAYVGAVSSTSPSTLLARAAS